MISEDIHHSRRQQSDAAPTLQERSSGVGAESDQIGPKRGSDQDEEEEGNLEKGKALSVWERDNLKAPDTITNTQNSC